MEETPTTGSVGNDHDLLIRIDEQLRMFLGVQRDHTTKIAEHDTRLNDHDQRLGHSITVKGLLTGVASAIGGSLGFMQLIEWIQKAH